MSIRVIHQPDLTVPDREGRPHKWGPRIILHTPFALKDLVRDELPGRQWAPRPQGFWHIPATVDAAGALRTFLETNRIEALIDRATLELIARSEQATAAQVNKTLDDLPEIPGKYCQCPDGPAREDEHGEDTQGICARCGQVIESWMHQRQAYHWAEPREGAALQMAMGTGKSKVTVALADRWSVDRMIIVAPPKAVRIWPRQFRDNSSRDWIVVNHGGRRRDGKLRLKGASMRQRIEAAEKGLQMAERTGRPFCLVVNYEASWQRPLRDWLLARRWQLGVADESHKIKSPGGKWSKFMELLRDRCERRLLLTGTFMPHDELDVYAQMRFQDPGIFGTSYKAFKDRFFAWGGYEGRQLDGFISDERRIEFLTKLSQASIVIDDDVLDLPPQKDMEPDVFQLEEKSRRHYAELLEEWQTDLGQADDDEPLRVQNTLAQMTRLSQVTSGHLPYDEGEEREIITIGDEKAKALEELMSGIPTAEPIVVFCRFRADLDRVQEIAERQGRRYKEISGRSDAALDDDGRMVADCDVCGVQLQAGGVGIDLTRARYAIYYSLDFNLGNFDQSRKRVHRPGQRRETLYYYLLAAGTIDEVILHALRHRGDVIRDVTQAIKTGDFDVPDPDMEAAYA